MSKRVLVFDEAYRMLEEAREQRIQDGWKRGDSLEQIASEAIIFWYSQGDNERFRDNNDEKFIIENAGKPVSVACEKCGQPGESYHFPDSEELHFFCHDHAKEAGFCPSCGNFVAGIEIEDFVFMPKYGVCSECYRGTQEELSQEDDEGQEAEF